MDKVGLLADISVSVANIYQGRKWLEMAGLESNGRISFADGLSLGLDVFRKIQSYAANDLHILFVAEYTFIGQELEYCAPNDKEAITSLRNAIKEFDEAFLALDVLETPEIYKPLDKTYPHKKEFRYHNMPKDSFHVACAGHITRIDNILKAPGISSAEKEFLKQRRSNIATAQSIYLEKQKQILLTQ